MQYDSPVLGSELEDGLAANPSLSDDTLAAIAAILDLQPDTPVNVGAWNGNDPIEAPTDSPEIVIAAIAGAPGDQVNLDLPTEAMASASVWIFESDADITVTFNTIERVIAMGNGNDLVTVDGDANTTLDGGDGNDTLVTSGGDDSVTAGNGDDSISTGAGNDTIVSTAGADTIDGGDGYDVVQTSGSADDWTITIVDGQLVLTSTTDAGRSITATNVEFFLLDDGSISVTGNDTDANTLRLYEGLIGRSADVEGAQYWLQDVNSEGRTVLDIANAFMATEEYAAGLGDATDTEFVEALYLNALGRAGSADEVAYWVGDLESGQGRANVAVSIIGSTEAADHIVSVQVLDGLV